MTDPRAEVSLGCRVLASRGQGDFVFGHVSARDPDGRGAWMKAASLGIEEVGPEQVLLVDREGAVLAGEGRRHAEYPIHLEVLAARADVGAVVHTHPPHALAFMATGAELRPISHEGTLFTPPAIARFTRTGDLILTRELGEALAAALGDRNALLLHHHGIVAAGPDVPTAVVTAVLLERACRLQLAAMRCGGVAHWSADEEALAKREHCWSSAHLRATWDYLVRRLGTGVIQ